MDDRADDGRTPDRTHGGIAYAVGEGAPAAPVAGEFIPGDVPAQSGTMDAMVAPVNALVMCMVEQGPGLQRPG